MSGASAVDVVVIGGGIAGLVAARECLKVGLDTVVLEARPEIGGCIASAELDGLRVDVGAESFATRGGHVAQLIDELGLADSIVSPAGGGAWLALDGGDGGPRFAPMPKTGVLGIPASPLANDVRAVIGTRAAIRAYADRLLPVLTIGRESNLGELVEKRMGRAVLDNLVAPIATGVYSADPRHLDVDVVAPGLNPAMTRAGSLSGAVSQLAASRPAGTAVQGLRGGMTTLVDALRASIEHFAGRIETGDPVDGLRRDGGHWVVTRGAGDDTRARFVIIATPAAAALPWLAEARPDWAAATTVPWPAGPPVELVTLVVDAPDLGAPRGSGLLVVEGTPGVAAKAMTHASAKWGWLSEEASGRHVIRLSYGRLGAANPLDELDDAAVTALALADASALLGRHLGSTDVRAVERTSWRDALSHAAIGQRERVDVLESLVREDPSIAVTGAWLAGTGLASVVPHAKEAALRIRHHAVGLTPSP